MPNKPERLTLTSFGFDTRLGPQAALDQAAKFLRGSGLEVKKPTDPCPRYQGKIPGVHIHFPIALTVDGEPVSTLLEIRAYFVGTRGRIGGGSTTLDMSLTADSTPVTNGRAAKEAAYKEVGPHFEKLKIALQDLEKSVEGLELPSTTGILGDIDAAWAELDL